MGKPLQVAVGSDVRAWARDNGVEVGARGRFKPEVIKAFNDAHKGVSRYAEGNEKLIDLKVKVNGKSRTKRFTVTEIREAAGEAAGGRGPLSNKALDAAAAALSS